MMRGVEHLAAVEEVVDTLGEHDIARDGQVHNLDATGLRATEIALDGLADLVQARDRPIWNRFPYGVAGEVARDLTASRWLHASNSARTISSGVMLPPL